MSNDATISTLCNMIHRCKCFSLIKLLGVTPQELNAGMEQDNEVTSKEIVIIRDLSLIRTTTIN